MKPDYEPIQISTNPDFNEIEVYFAHDIHKGSAQHDDKKWRDFKTEILATENRFVIFAGDYCETAILGSKSDIYTQDYTPSEQQNWFTQQLYDLRNRTLAIVPGNHEARITKATGLYPVYECALLAECADKYRHHFAFVDIGVGKSGKGTGRQQHYVGYVVHRLRDNKSFNGSDFIEGIDFAAYGHDHEPSDHPRGKLCYNPINKFVYHKNIDIINNGAFLSYSGYGVEAGYRPKAQKLYKLVLSGTKHKSITTIGYYI